jgi:N-methylhydantoinase A
VSWLIGVDVGGTFTDFFAYETHARAIRLFKTPSTPDNPATAIADGLIELCTIAGIDPKDVLRLCHGTTVATNALIERKGSRVAMITTRGFRDLLEIGRQTRPHLYSLQIDHPEPLVPRHRRFEVTERMTDKARIVTPFDEASLQDAVARVMRSGAQSCAVCLLFSFLDDSHERRVGEALARADKELMVSLSSHVQPEFREYERFSTAVLNAYLQPVIGKYLSDLERRVRTVAAKADLGVYQSSGGLMSIEEARGFPVRTALSGPAAGAIGAIYNARISKEPDIITLDMGGTSADVALVRNYQASIAFDRAVAGYPVRLPMVDIHTIGAGGGSIAWFDDDGLLKVGPLSAGAVPGPACYGKGGKEATVTDANLLLGRLSAGGLIGGRMPLDLNAAREAVAPIAARLEFSVERTALGILDIVVANMVRAIRTVSVERGHDPRGYCLLPFGGAGPLHASAVARALGISRFLVPAAPGILCAQGLITSDLKRDFVRSARTELSRAGLRFIQSALKQLKRAADDWFGAQLVARANRKLALSLDMRYIGQNFELSVPIGIALGGRLPPIPAADKLRARFFVVHDRYYGFHNEADPVEIISVRLVASAALTKLRPAGKAKASRRSRPKPVDQRGVWFSYARPARVEIFHREHLQPGDIIPGPAVIEQFDSTTILYPGDRLRVDDARNLLVTVGR